MNAFALHPHPPPPQKEKRNKERTCDHVKFKYMYFEMTLAMHYFNSRRDYNRLHI
jgi:hypothetical protein